MELYRCTRCTLLFGSEGIPVECPSCRRRSSIPPRIELSGRDVTEFVVRDYGMREGLLDPDVRKGLATMRLGQCPHGWLTSAICSACCN